MEEAFEKDTNTQQAIKAGLIGAIEGYDNTATMLAVHGRAAARGEASRQFKDPGAAVAILMMSALDKSVEKFSKEK